MISRNSIRNTKKVAQKYLAGENVKISTAQKIYANRIKDIPNITGRELDLGFYITGKEILKGRKTSRKTQARRIKAYEKITGRTASKQEKASLKYMTASKLAKSDSIKGIKAPKITTKIKSRIDYIDIEEPIEPKLGKVRWEQLPDDIRNGDRSPRSFIYRNKETLFDSDWIDLDDLLGGGSDGEDLTIRGFIEQVKDFIGL